MINIRCAPSSAGWRHRRRQQSSTDVLRLQTLVLVRHRRWLHAIESSRRGQFEMFPTVESTVDRATGKRLMIQVEIIQRHRTFFWSYQPLLLMRIAAIGTAPPRFVPSYIRVGDQQSCQLSVPYNHFMPSQMCIYQVSAAAGTVQSCNTSAYCRVGNTRWPVESSTVWSTVDTINAPNIPNDKWTDYVGKNAWNNLRHDQSSNDHETNEFRQYRQ